MNTAYTRMTDHETTLILDKVKIMLPDFSSEKDPQIILDDESTLEISDGCLLKLTTWFRERIYKKDLKNYIQEIIDGDEEPPERVTAELLQENFDEIVEYYIARRENDDSWHDDLCDAVQSFVEWNT